MASQILHIPIDKAGRVVLPKEIRERMGLHAGSEFEVIEETNRIILKPLSQEPKIVSRGGIFVVVPDEDEAEKGPRNILKKQREERDSKFW